MRLSLLLALVLVGATAATYWYQTTKYRCPIPVTYTIGQVDQAFSRTPEEVRAAVAEAAALWEAATQLDLFQYHPTEGLPISFVFDERQATADAQSEAARRLDVVASDNDTLKATISDLQTSYTELRQSFTTRRAAYEAALDQYNTAVRQANDQGGADEAAFAAFQAEQTRLQTESQALQAQAAELRTVAANLNQLSTEGNRLIAEYNEQVRQYNNQYTEGEAFTQGDYTGDAIHVYKFSNEVELLAVLAHELGHALGIAHVEESDAIMYYLLEESATTTVQLSAADIAAVHSICQIGSWEFRVRQLIRSVL